MLRPQWLMLALLIAGGPTGIARGDEACPARPTARPGAAEPLFEALRLSRLVRLRAEFTEEKHIALLARPLRSSGTIYFDRDRGVARVTAAPRAERVLLTPTTLRIEKGGKVEEIPLEKSKALRAFALVFPALLRGERAALEAEFDIELRGSPQSTWSLVLVPKDPALCGMIGRVAVSGRGSEVEALQVVEASGDTTDTRFSGTRRNDDVPAAELVRGFGAP